MEKSKTTIEAVLCRLEAKELSDAADKFTTFHDSMLEGMKTQFFVTAGQMAVAKKDVISLREFGLILARVGLMAIAASEDEEGDHEDA